MTEGYMKEGMIQEEKEEMRKEKGESKVRMRLKG